MEKKKIHQLRVYCPKVKLKLIGLAKHYPTFCPVKSVTLCWNRIRLRVLIYHTKQANAVGGGGVKLPTICYWPCKGHPNHLKRKCELPLGKLIRNAVWSLANTQHPRQFKCLNVLCSKSIPSWFARYPCKPKRNVSFTRKTQNNNNEKITIAWSSETLSIRSKSFWFIHFHLFYTYWDQKKHICSVLSAAWWSLVLSLC